VSMHGLDAHVLLTLQGPVRDFATADAAVRLHRRIQCRIAPIENSDRTSFNLQAALILSSPVGISIETSNGVELLCR